jgi:hypothetical protein
MRNNRDRHEGEGRVRVIANHEAVGTGETYVKFDIIYTVHLIIN